MTAACALVGSYSQLALARIGVGIGKQVRVRHRTR